MLKSSPYQGITSVVLCLTSLLPGLQGAHATTIEPDEAGNQVVTVELRADIPGPTTIARIASRVGKVVGHPAPHTYEIHISPQIPPEIALRELKQDTRIKAATPSSLVTTKRTPRFATVTQLNRYIAQQEAIIQRLANADIAFFSAQLFSAEIMNSITPVIERNREIQAGLEHLKASAFYLNQRAYPRDRIDAGAYQLAADHRDSMLPLSGTTWTFIGPKNLAAPYTGYFGPGPLSGRVNGIACIGNYPPSPPPASNSSTPERFYVASAGGGVWRYTSNTENWEPLSDDWPTLQTTCIAIDPRAGISNPPDQDVLYVGTGDFDANEVNTGMGIMKSSDGGKTWTPSGANRFSNVAVSKIVIDPEKPDIVIAATGRGRDWQGKVWRSENAGVDWQAVILPQPGRETAWSDLAYSLPEADGHRHYYAVGHFNELWRSEDQGKSWTDLSSNLVYQLYTKSIGPTLKIAVSQIDPKTVYLISGADQKVLRSADAGATWSDITGNITNNWKQADYDLYLACGTVLIDGSVQDVLYAGLVTLSRADRGGRFWNDVGVTRTHGALTHNDQHAMSLHPYSAKRGEAIVGNDGGVYRLSYGSTGQPTFASLNLGMGITQFYTLACHPSNADKMLGGTQDNATPLALGDLDNWSNIGGGDGGSCIINQADPRIQYACSEEFDGLYITTDEWQRSIVYNDKRGSDAVAWVPPMALDPGRPDLLYIGTNYISRYTQSKNSWEDHLGNQPLAISYEDDPGYILCLAVAPTDGNRIYAGTNHGDLWMTSDAGKTWFPINQGQSSLPDRAITCINVNPKNANDILIGLSGTGSDHLWECRNTAAGVLLAWNPISGPKNPDGTLSTKALPDIALNAVTRDLTDPDNVFYVGMDVGVFMTIDGGSTWYNATRPLGLPNVRVNDIKAVKGTGYLTVATFGRGIWRMPIASGSRPHP